jgi:hypothetical protein
VLIGAGSVTYGKNSHYARAAARMRPPDPPNRLDPNAPTEAPDPPP